MSDFPERVLGSQPVFPIPERRSDYGEVLEPAYRGLTKREYFAGEAMRGLLADPEVNAKRKAIAQVSVAHADALLKELARG